MSVRTGSKMFALMVFFVPCLALGANPVVMEPGEGPAAGLEIKEVFDNFVQVSEHCEGSGGNAIACICSEGVALERLNRALASALEKHPDWRERSLQYRNFGDDSTLQISVPALQEQMSMMAAQCD